MYDFLVKLPADEKALETIDDPSVSYLDMFPLGQPFKCLYAVHALRDYLKSRRSKTAASETDGQEGDTDERRVAFSIRAMSLIVPAISDPQITAQCRSPELQIELGSALVELFVSLLGGQVNPPSKGALMFRSSSSCRPCSDQELPASAARFLDGPLLERLLAILSLALSADTPESATKHVPHCLQSILQSCCASDAFMSAFCAHPAVPRLFEELLLNERRVEVRESTARLIRQICGPTEEGEGYVNCASATISCRRS